MTQTFKSPITGHVYPVRELSDGRHIALSESGWFILEGDGQARSQAIRDEAWTITFDWQESVRRESLIERAEQGDMRAAEDLDVLYLGARR